MGEQVSLVGCGSYERDLVRERVERAFELLGGARSIANSGAAVFVKVNNVIAAAPETGIVTHPEVARAVIEQFKKVTDDITVGDSPGGPFTPGFLRRVYGRTGLEAVARETGAKLGLDTTAIDVRLPGGKALKRVTLSRPMAEADCLVSVSKFKTHRYLNVTGPIKNLYGAVPGTTKFVYHSRFDDEREFADLVVDVHLAAGPSFHVLDAVRVTEGEGSRHGTSRDMGCLVAGRNAFALESLITRLAGLEPSDDRVLSAAVSRGICPEGTGWFEVLGDDPEEFRISGFVMPEANFFSERMPAALTGMLSRLVAPTPEPVKGVCTLCGRCVDFCPRGAMSLGDEAALVDKSKCIRCFCCDELCEQRAIEIRKPALARFLRR